MQTSGSGQESRSAGQGAARLHYTRKGIRGKSRLDSPVLPANFSSARRADLRNGFLVVGLFQRRDSTLAEKGGRDLDN